MTEPSEMEQFRIHLLRCIDLSYENPSLKSLSLIEDHLDDAAYRLRNVVHNVVREL